MTKQFALNEQPTHSAGSTRKKRYACSYPNCTMQFDRVEHLTRHERKHTGEKPFECKEPTCFKRFSRYDNMVQHAKVHIGNKKNKMRECKRKQTKLAHEPLPTGESDSTPPPVVGGLRPRRGLSIQELCHPFNQEIMASARLITRNELQAIGVLVIISHEL